MSWNSWVIRRRLFGIHGYFEWNSLNTHRRCTTYRIPTTVCLCIGRDLALPEHSLLYSRRSLSGQPHGHRQHVYRLITPPDLSHRECRDLHSHTRYFATESLKLVPYIPSKKSLPRPTHSSSMTCKTISEKSRASFWLIAGRPSFTFWTRL